MRLITPIVSVHSPYACSIEQIKKASNFANEKDTLLTMHVNEMDYEVKEIFEREKKSVVEYLASHNLLNDRLLLAHMIYTQKEDFSLLKKFDVKIVTNPTANLKSAKGIAPVYDMIEAGITVGIGTDGPISCNSLELFKQLPLVAMLQKTLCKDRTIMKAKKVLEMVTIDAAEILRCQDKIGSLEVGKQADIVVLKTGLQLFPIHDIYSTIVYGSSLAHVKDVYVQGRCLVKNHKLVYEDEQTLKRNVQNEMKIFNELIKSM